MKPKTLILMGVAVVCGLVASYMTSQLISQQEEKVWILKSNGKYAQWSTVKDPVKMFRAEEIKKTEAPKNYYPGDAFREGLDPKLRDALASELRNRAFLKSVSEGDILVRSDLQLAGRGGMDGVLPDGKRAFAIKTDMTRGGGGFVLPGSHVDIMQVQRTNRGVKTSYVLQNMLVRAVDLAQTRPEDRNGIIPSVVTFEVTPEEALKLGEVGSGDLILVLRPMGDTKKVEEVRADDPLAAPPPPPPPLVETPAPITTAKGSKPVEPVKPREYRRRVLVFNGPTWKSRTYYFDPEGHFLRFEDAVSSDAAADANQQPPGAKPPMPMPGTGETKPSEDAKKPASEDSENNN